MYGRECTFKLRMDAIPIMTCTNRFVILIENASVLTLNHTSGLFCFKLVTYNFMVKQSTFLIENELEGMYTFDFCAEAKPILASMNRFVILIDNASMKSTFLPIHSEWENLTVSP